MISGVAFDLYGPLFSVNGAAGVLGVKPSGLVMNMQRGVDEPSTREGGSGSKKKKKGIRRGRARFSARDLVKSEIQRTLADMGFSLAKIVLVGDELKSTPKTVAARLSKIEPTEVADRLAMGGEWMWALARSIERGRPLFVYAYAARLNGEWLVDMHVENPDVKTPTEPPSFGSHSPDVWSVPHVFVPVGAIFSRVYDGCKVLLGLSNHGETR